MRLSLCSAQLSSLSLLGNYKDLGSPGMYTYYRYYTTDTHTRPHTHRTQTHTQTQTHTHTQTSGVVMTAVWLLSMPCQMRDRSLRSSAPQRSVCVCVCVCVCV